MKQLSQTSILSWNVKYIGHQKLSDESAPHSLSSIIKVLTACRSLAGSPSLLSSDSWSDWWISQDYDCYYCCRLTMMKSWTQACFLIYCHCGKKQKSILKGNTGAYHSFRKYKPLWHIYSRSFPCCEPCRSHFPSMNHTLSLSFYKIEPCQFSSYIPLLQIHSLLREKKKTSEEPVGSFAITFIWNCPLLCTMKSNFGQPRFATAAEAAEFQSCRLVHERLLSDKSCALTGSLFVLLL